jgi:CHAD domain-containing protein
MKDPLICTKEPFQTNMSRLLLHYHRQAAGYLQRPGNIHENIHQARLCFKRIRSYLRLGRRGLGRVVYNEYNVFYRDLSRSLSLMRDLTALIETLPWFIKSRRTAAARNFLLRFKANLITERRHQLNKMLATGVLSEVVAALANRENEIENLSFDKPAAEVFLSGASRIYGRGRHLFAVAQLHPDDHTMHEWRKQVKYFWYHLLVLSPLWPGLFTAWAKEVQILSQLLGKHHDLVLLQNAPLLIQSTASNPEIIKSLKQSVERRKHQLELRCMALGSLVYAEETALLQERLSGYWK